jgi:hypothetical protein
MVGAPFRHVDRHVAEEADAAFARVLAERPPLTLEANLVGDGLLSARRSLATPT